MSQFILGVLASLAGGFILLVLTRFSRGMRKLLSKVLNVLSGGDIEYVFYNKSDPSCDLPRKLQSAKDVAIFTSRGNELQRDTFISLFLKRYANSNVRVRILLPSTSLETTEYDWTAQRERELAAFDSSFGDKLLHRQIDMNVAFLHPHIREGKVELRRYNAPHIGRIVLVDGVAYYTPYNAETHGRDSKIYKFKAGGAISCNLHRLFDQLWSAASVDSPKAT